MLQYVDKYCYSRNQNKQKGARVQMFETHIRPARDLRTSFPEIEKLVREKNQVVITKHGRGNMVLIDYEEYQAYENFLRERFITQELMKADIEAEKPGAAFYSIDEAFQLAGTDDEL